MRDVARPDLAVTGLKKISLPAGTSRPHSASKLSAFVRKKILAEYNPMMKTMLIAAVTWGLMVSMAWAVPALTPAQEEQIKTANDSVPGTDDPALYPLMENALSWQNGDEVGAMVPDLAAIAKSPAEFRGKLFLIEGQFAGRARLEGDTLQSRARPGAWTGKLQEWVIYTNLEKEESVVVYLVDPPVPVSKKPQPGTPTRLVARFYKANPDKDLKGNPTVFLTFVAKSATFTTPETGTGMSSSALQAIGVIAVLGVVYMIFRIRKAIKGAKKSEFSLHKDETHEEREKRLAAMRAEEAGAPPLPSNPVDALAELERRRIEKENQE